MKLKQSVRITVFFLFLFSGKIFAQDIFLPSIISDNMVLQQNTTVSIWGWAFRNVEVTVKPEWGTAKSVRADSTGKWKINIETPLAGAGGPYKIEVLGGGTNITLKNILIGEVWLCSGQSNMEMPLRGWPPKDTVLNAYFEYKNPTNTKIRMFTVTRALSVMPSENCRGSWEEASPEKIKNFSATAYFFGKKLFEELKIPIGLIHTSWGGTPIEAWMSLEALSMYPEYKNLQENYRQLAGEQSEKKAWLEKHPKIDIAGFPAESKWKNLKFNDSLCALPELYDFEWERMRLPMKWEESSLGDFDGAVWFRKTIDVPAAWSNKELILKFPGIDDMDQTWVNGQVVGKTESPGFWQTARRYEIPAALVKPGKLLIAVRVIDHQGGGGIWDTKPPMELFLKSDSTEKISISGYWRYLPVAEYKNDVFYIFDSKTREYQLRSATKNPGPGLPSVLFNAMIYPLINYKVKGFLWYQGESNVGDAKKYTDYMSSMVEAWRKHWGAELPFYFVQIAPYKYTGVLKSESAELRYAQLLAQNKIKKSGMVVTMDIGDVNNIHPCRKREVGVRLAHWALAKDYSRQLYHTGPTYKSKTIEGTKIRIAFDNLGLGLEMQGKALTGFEIAGADKKYVEAKAVIENNTVVVSSDKVVKPMYVRYAWYNGSEASLFNKEGLPVSTFSSEY